MMYNYDDIRMVHLEMTERCQAACPMCLRNYAGGRLNKHITMAELSESDIKTIFHVKFVKQLQTIYACGNYGDPIIAKDLLPAFRYFRETNPKMFLNVHTNGGARDKDWWVELADIIRFRGYVTFGIDGLSDTNDIYRQNVVWDKVIENAQAFIQAGGVARWNFIVFRHNEHQIEEAKALAKKIGFTEIVFKKTSRFTDGNGIKSDSISVTNSKTGKKFALEEPLNSTYRNQLAEKAGKNFKLALTDKTSPVIRCKSLINREIYISAEGLVHPCCWTAGDMYKLSDVKYIGDIWNFLIDKDSINAKYRSIKEILNDSYITDFDDNWSKKTISEGLCEVCVKNCTVGHDAQSAQFEIKQII